MTLALPPGSPSAHWPGALVPSTMPRFPVTVRFPGYNPTQLLLSVASQGPLNWILDTHSLWGQARADVLIPPVLIL